MVTDRGGSRERTGRPPAWRWACDSLVALGPGSADGATVFAKNSDRPAGECQPLCLVPRARHARGSTVRCTYVEIPQVAETARVLGSRPFWCWGFEHGLNEHGVVIGNHTVFTKDPVSGVGLIGMDLVRLALERAGSAEAAVGVITALLEAYGQGGSGYADKEWPYHNSFLLADRTRAFVLETSDRHWVLREVHEIGSASNHLTIATDWDRVSSDVVAHAVNQGWWPSGSADRFDFAAAYRDVSVAPPAVSSGRYARTCAILAQRHGGVDTASLKAALRDHAGQPLPPFERSLLDPDRFSVCMHADPVGTTTASMVVRVPSDPQDPLLYWAGLGSPCVGVFLPLFVDADVPAILLGGNAGPSVDSAWWRCHRLLTAVERDWSRHLPVVRATFDRFEAQMLDELETTGVARASRDARSAFVGATAQRWLDELDAVTARLS